MSGAMFVHIYRDARLFAHQSPRHPRMIQMNVRQKHVPYVSYACAMRTQQIVECPPTRRRPRIHENKAGITFGTIDRDELRTIHVPQITIPDTTTQLNWIAHVSVPDECCRLTSECTQVTKLLLRA